MHFRFLLLLILTATSSQAVSGCLENCICGKEMKRLRLPSPRGLHPATVCHLMNDAGRISLSEAKLMSSDQFHWGDYEYQGELTLIGKVCKNDDGEVYFLRKSQHKNVPTTGPVSTLQKYVRLEDVEIYLHDNGQLGTAHVKPATAEDQWCAKGTISVTKLSIRIQDSCAEGVTAVSYDALQIGRFRKEASHNAR